MYKNFILFDKNNNLQKTADVIVRFNLGENDYLVYAIGENEQNSQIFVSKLILNSEGKYFIDSVSVDEKNKLSNVVYNIVILIPTDAKKGSSFEELSNNLVNKFSVKLFHNVSITETQEYYSNCSIAITNNLLVESAIKFYNENLNSIDEKSVPELPMWTTPIEVTPPAPVDNDSINILEKSINSSLVDSSQAVIPDMLDLQSSVPQSNLSTEKLMVDSQNNSVNSIDSVVNVNSQHVDNSPIQTEQRIAIVSDPSLGLGSVQTKNKSAGFASTKYVIIGTVGLILAVVVVIVAFILIRNIK